jgi:hypothetical protein
MSDETNRSTVDLSAVPFQLNAGQTPSNDRKRTLENQQLGILADYDKVMSNKLPRSSSMYNRLFFFASPLAT